MKQGFWVFLTFVFLSLLVWVFVFTDGPRFSLLQAKPKVQVKLRASDTMDDKGVTLDTLRSTNRFLQENARQIDRAEVFVDHVPADRSPFGSKEGASYAFSLHTPDGNTIASAGSRKVPLRILDVAMSRSMQDAMNDYFHLAERYNLWGKGVILQNY